MLVRSADGGNRGFDGGGIDGGRLISREAEQNGAIGRVAQSRERQRAVQVGLHSGNAIVNAERRKFAGKSAGSAHRAHGVRTGRANADFVEIEEAGGHG